LNFILTPDDKFMIVDTGEGVMIVWNIDRERCLCEIEHASKEEKRKMVYMPKLMSIVCGYGSGLIQGYGIEKIMKKK